MLSCYPSGALEVLMGQREMRAIQAFCALKHYHFVDSNYLLFQVFPANVRVKSHSNPLAFKESIYVFGVELEGALLTATWQVWCLTEAVSELINLPSTEIHSTSMMEMNMPKCPEESHHFLLVLCIERRQSLPEQLVNAISSTHSFLHL